MVKQKGNLTKYIRKQRKDQKKGIKKLNEMMFDRIRLKQGTIILKGSLSIEEINFIKEIIKNELTIYILIIKQLTIHIIYKMIN